MSAKQSTDLAHVDAGAVLESLKERLAHLAVMTAALHVEMTNMLEKAKALPLAEAD